MKELLDTWKDEFPDPFLVYNHRSLSKLELELYAFFLLYSQSILSIFPIPIITYELTMAQKKSLQVPFNGSEMFVFFKIHMLKP